MGIFSFYDFVNEKLGVSEASLIFVSILESRSMGIFREFINSEDKSLKITEDINYIILRPYIKDVQLYSKFPVTKFELDITYKKLTQKEWDKKYSSYTKKIATGGVASFFGNKNWSGYSKIVEPIKQITEHSIIVNLGISIDVSPSFNIDRKEHVNELVDDGAAKKAGMQIGDVILKVNGIATKSVPERQEQIGSRNPGDEVILTVFRNGQQKDLNIKLKE